MLFSNFFEFHIFHKPDNQLISTFKDPILALNVLDGLSYRDEYMILDSFSRDVTAFCEEVSEQELSSGEQTNE